MTFDIQNGVLIKVHDCEAHVVIPDSVTSIGEDAFMGCIALQSVTIPDSVTSIGNYAFLGCASLQSVSLPDSVTSIKRDTFIGCTSLRSFSISPNHPLFYFENDMIISRTGTTLFALTNIVNVVIPDSVTSIGRGAFSNCSSLQSIVIPDSVTSIGEYAFVCCSSLQSVSIPDSVTSIEEETFAHCPSMHTIELAPKHFAMLDSNASEMFDDPGTWLTSNPKRYVDGILDIVNTIICIAPLRDIPKKYQSKAFRGFELHPEKYPAELRKEYLCYSLENELPPDRIARNPLPSETTPRNPAPSVLPPFGNRYCPRCARSVSRFARTCMCCSAQLPPYSPTPSDTPKNDAKPPLPSTPPSPFDIHNGVPLKYHGSDAPFIRCPRCARSVSRSARTCLYCGAQLPPHSPTPSDTPKNAAKPPLPGTPPSPFFDIHNGVLVKYHGSDADVTIPDSVSTIGEFAFSHCSALQSIVIPDSVTAIDEGAFEGCSFLKSVTIPDSVKHIGSRAFKGCSALSSISIPDSLVNIKPDSFDDSSRLKITRRPAPIEESSSPSFPKPPRRSLLASLWRKLRS